jgi:hypothetical protein
MRRLPEVASWILHVTRDTTRCVHPDALGRAAARSSTACSRGAVDEGPFRVATGGKTVTWITSSIDVQAKKLDDVYTVLGRIGLLAIVFGTLLQMLATLERR